MNRVFSMRPNRAFLAFAVLDLVFFAMGMGVPIFCILFGFAAGWYIVKNASGATEDLVRSLGVILRYAIVASSFTFLVMAVAWGRTVSLLFDPKADFVEFGIPMILYQPRASFIGWLVLMVVISPFLQLLTILFGSYLTLLVQARRVSH